MTHPLAPQRCADLTNALEEERGSILQWPASAFSGDAAPQSCIAFRRYVEAVSEAVKQFREEWALTPVALTNIDRLLGQFVLREPVDPLLVEARRIAAHTKDGPLDEFDETDQDILDGKRDESFPVEVALAALRRGIEIGRAERG